MGITANSADGLPVLDMDECLENLGGDKDLYIDIVAIFTRTVPHILQELIYALQTEDTAKAGSLAHNLKGMSANIGAKRLAELARTIHASAGIGRKGDLEQWPDRLREEFESLMNAIDCPSSMFDHRNAVSCQCALSGGNKINDLH